MDAAAASSALQDRMANIWLTDEEQTAWVAANRQAHYNLFASFVAFNLINVLIGKLFSRRRRFKDAKAAAMAQHGATQLAHSAFAVAIAVRALAARPSLMTSPCPADRLFYYDADSFLALDLHAGYLFYEWIFYTNNSDVLISRFSLAGVHRVLLLVGYTLARVHPCALTVAVLPFYELLAAAQGAEGLLDLAIGLDRPAGTRLRRLGTLILLSLLRAAAAGAIALYSWWWISSTGLAGLQGLPASRAAVNAAFAVMAQAGGLALAGIYMVWFRIAGVSMEQAKAALVRQREAKAADAAAAAAKKRAAGPAKKQKKALRA